MADYIDAFRKSKRRNTAHVANDERRALEELGWSDEYDRVSVQGDGPVATTAINGSAAAAYKTTTAIPLWKIAFIIAGIQFLLNLPCSKSAIKSVLPFFKNETYILLFNSLIIFVASIFLLNLSSNKT